MNKVLIKRNNYLKIYKPYVSSSPVVEYNFSFWIIKFVKTTFLYSSLNLTNKTNYGKYIKNKKLKERVLCIIIKDIV